MASLEVASTVFQPLLSLLRLPWGFLGLGWNFGKSTFFKNQNSLKTAVNRNFLGFDKSLWSSEAFIYGGVH